MKADDLTAGPLALPAPFTWRFQQASPLVKNLISIRSRSRFRGRSEMSTRRCGGPQVVWQKKFGPIGVSGSPRRFDRKMRVVAQADFDSVVRHARRRGHAETASAQVAHENSPSGTWSSYRSVGRGAATTAEQDGTLPWRQRTHPVALSYSPTPEGIASVKCRLGRPRSARRRDEHRDSRRGRACRSPRYGMPYPIRAYTITKVSSRSAATRLV